MDNLRDEVQDEELKLAFTRGMNNHPKDEKTLGEVHPSKPRCIQPGYA